MQAAAESVDDVAARRDRIRRAAPRVLERAGVPLIYRAARLSDFPTVVATDAGAFLAARSRRWEPSEAHERDKDLAPESLTGCRPHGLVIKGKAGVGKTRLAAAVLGTVASDWYLRFGFYHARALLRRIWETFRESSPRTESEVLTELAELAVLVIDDFGHEGRVTDGSLNALHELLDTRTSNCRTTIVTTNLTITEIAQHYDGAIASRLGGWDQLTLTGVDRRRH